MTTAARTSTPLTELSLRALAISLIVLLLVYPVFAVGTRRWIVSVFMTAIFFGSVAAVADRPRQRLIALAVGIPWCLLTWFEAASSTPSPSLLLVTSVLGVVFLLFILKTVLDFVLRVDTVTGGVIWGAVAIYMLLGGLWFVVYAYLARTQPGTFIHVAGGAGPVDWTEMLYYSYVTLTTLGYGDIVPGTLLARHLAVAEAIIGVLYLPIVISRLVAGFGGRESAPSSH